MFDRLAGLVTRWPRTIVLLSLALVGLALWYGADVTSRLATGGQTDPGSESALAARALEQHFVTGRPNLVLLVHCPDGADAPAVAAEGTQLADLLAAERNVTGVVSYWQTRSADLRSMDGRKALVVARIEGSERDADAVLDALRPRYSGDHGPVTVQLGGSSAVRHEVTDTIRGDILRAEVIGIPLTAVVLLLVFRSFLAAVLPLLVGIMAVVVTNASLKAISTGTEVSVFALNLATGLSLGLAADYGLFIVRRYREELRHGHDVGEAVRVTLNTAGRTVAYSCLTVAVAVSAMLVFPLYFLRSFAYAGVSVVLVAALAALVTLPAALVALGRHIDIGMYVFYVVANRLRGRRQPAAPGVTWRRIAETVMRRPLSYALAATAFLLALGAPFLHVSFGLPDDRLLPVGFESHQVQQALRDGFDSRPTGEIDVVATDVDPAEAAVVAAVGRYAQHLSTLDMVVRVQSIAGAHQHGQLVAPPGPASARFAAPGATYLAVTSTAEDVSAESQALVQRIRAVPPPFPVRVAGGPADLVDAKTALVSRLPWAAAIIATTTLVLIFLLTGSVLIPVKALVMNVLSLSATFGALVWIFQDYHLAGLLSFQQTGWVDVTLLVLLFCVAFGVSMDYEVFLLSRMKEEYARTGDNRLAVAYGIEKTGGVVTAAALVTSIVFIAMGSSRVTNIKMFGVGLAMAMVADATVVRTILVPALMRLAGPANWWAPRPLRLVYERIGLREDSGARRMAPAPQDQPVFPAAPHPPVPSGTGTGARGA